MNRPHDASNHDRNLLLGIIALQVNFITKDTLVAAMNEWALAQHQSLGDILLRHNALTPDQLHALHLLLQQHLLLHENDPEQSLRALGGVPSEMELTADYKHPSGGSADPAAEETTAAPPPRPGIRYRIVRHHADGGQGRVYLANDGELNRQVALKENKPPHENYEESRLRLVLEAEITGGLEHPGIVPVYGLGKYDDGRPFYAMRFIRGDSLDAAIRFYYASVAKHGQTLENRLAFRNLLRRFVDVCNAIAYAHSRGVVHRDIKPRNVMIGEFGETLVVDWGLAKVGSTPAAPPSPESPSQRPPPLRPASGSSVEATIDGAQIGTAPYMSPEQASGRISELGPATDIYSLGASLYVLLTGHAPVECASRDETLERVRAGDIAPPRAVNPEAPAPLDAICRKAMSLDPERRYAHALELADDIEHWLADEPVSAYPDPWRTKVARWGKRHRSAVSAAAIFLVCLAAGAGIVAAVQSLEKQKTAAQARIAEENLAISRRHTSEVLKLIEQSEPELAQAPQLHARRADLLRVATEACRDYRAQLPDEPELAARSAKIYRYAANFHRLQYEHADAARLYQEATALHEQFSSHPAAGFTPLALADLLRDIAAAEIAQGRFSAGETLLKRALEISERIPAKPGAEGTARQRELAMLYSNLGALQRRRAQQPADFDQASATLEKAAAHFRVLVDVAPSERDAYDPLLSAANVNQQAILAREMNELPRARSLHAEAARLLQALRQTNSTQRNQADVEFFLAEFTVEQCRTWARIDAEMRTKAETNSGVAINKLIELVNNYPALPNYRTSLAEALVDRAEIRLQNENPTGAREHLPHALTLLEPQVKQFSHVPELHAELARAYLCLAKSAELANDEPPAPWVAKANQEIQAARQAAPDERRWRLIEEEVAQMAVRTGR